MPSYHMNENAHARSRGERCGTESSHCVTINLPTVLLRSFVAIVDNGSMSSAASRVFVSQSALSLQIKRLEELVQKTLFDRQGPRLELTVAGSILLNYARRVLHLHDEALTAIQADTMTAPVRVGMVQDLADTQLSQILGRFAELHAGSRIFARVSRTPDLIAMLERSELDLILGFAGTGDPDVIRQHSMAWLGDPSLLENEVLPLAVLDRPCRFRDAAIASLDAIGRRYSIIVETPNLSMLRAAVKAKLGITCRTELFMSDEPRLMDPSLPPLPKIGYMVRNRNQLDPSTMALVSVASEAILAL